MTGPRNKHESIDLFARGCYGNTVPVYHSPALALADVECQKFTIRYRGEPGVQGPAVFGIPRNDLWVAWGDLIDKGWLPERLYCNPSMPDHRVVIQGELMLNHEDGWLFCGSERSGIHMREAMAEALAWAGWRAREILRSKMDPSSWDDLNCLIDMYPDAVIELVVFDTAYGSLAHTGRRLIVWEVRDGF